MKRTSSLAPWTFVFPLATLSCGAYVVTPLPPAVPIIPVSFETNLVTARECEYRGTAFSQEGAREEGANLVLAFEGTLGKAVNCPKEAIDKILAMSKSGSVQ
jgi:hypothetical protein